MKDGRNKSQKTGGRDERVGGRQGVGWGGRLGDGGVKRDEAAGWRIRLGEICRSLSLRF